MDFDKGALEQPLEIVVNCGVQELLLYSAFRGMHFE